MKNTICGILLCLIWSFGYTQPGIEIQGAGSNFAGFTINTSYKFALPDFDHFAITPYFGIGSMIPSGLGNSLIAHAGIDYHYKRWGLGLEVSGFTENPFVAAFEENEFIDMLIYPNLSYTREYRSNVYLKYSLGAFFAFSKNQNLNNEQATMGFETPVIPGIGITCGYRFDCRDTIDLKKTSKI